MLMIFKRSCDTENWSNDEDNSASHHWNYIILYFNIIYFVVTLF